MLRPQGGNTIPSRSERWKKFEYLGPIYALHGDLTEKEQNDLITFLVGVRKNYYEKHGIKPINSTISDWIKGCKELIYNIVDSKPVFHAISYSFHVGRAEIQLGHFFDFPIEGETPEDISEGVRSIMAHAFFAEIPVIPNTEDLVQELARHHRDLMINGFTAPDEAGNPVRLKVTKSPGKKLETVGGLSQLPLSEPRYPAELALLRNAVEKELERLSAADRVLGTLSLAIEALSFALTAEHANEREQLQSCLINNPILFGLDYQRVIPQHKLGKEYVMDYALERVSGVVDIVEIEASTHSLFNKNGDPTKYVAHAEQQVLDWLDWLERNYRYALDDLPGIVRPRGYVVIGRSKDMNEEQKRKLARRNQIFGDSLHVLTYDDLLIRAKNMKRLLLGPNLDKAGDI